MFVCCEFNLSHVAIACTLHSVFHMLYASSLADDFYLLPDTFDILVRCAMLPCIAQHCTALCYAVLCWLSLPGDANASHGRISCACVR